MTGSLDTDRTTPFSPRKRSYALLEGMTVVDFTSLELHRIGCRLGCLIQALKDGAGDSPKLERETLLLLGKGTALLRIMEQHLDSVHYGLLTDNEEIEVLPPLPPLRDL